MDMNEEDILFPSDQDDWKKAEEKEEEEKKENLNRIESNHS